MSAGYDVAEWRDGTDPATGMRTRTAARWTPREVSFVAIPADPNARTRQHPPLTGRAAVNREIRELGRRAGVGSETIDDLIDRSATLDDANRIFMQHVIARSEVHIRSAHNSETLLAAVRFNTFFGDG